MNEIVINNRSAENWDEMESTFAAHAARQHVPLSATFELTARCSLQCKMCYVRLEPWQVKAMGRELTAEEWISLGRQAIDAGTMFLLLTGGEPLLRPDFEQIYIALCKMGFIITLNTNATLMSEKYFELFSKYPPTAVAVTLYGSSPETYEKICGDASGFEKTVRGLEMFSKLPTNLEVRTTFIKDNMHELDAIRAIANRFTKRFAINIMVFKPTRGCTCDVEKHRMNPKECLDVDMANYKYYYELDDPETEALLANEEEWTPPPEGRDHGLDVEPAVITCLAAKSLFWLSWDGKMFPCGTFDEPFNTKPLEEGFIPAWNRLPTLFTELRHPDECMRCELLEGCPNCPAYFQCETGNPEEISPYLCVLSKERAMRYAQPL